MCFNIVALRCSWYEISDIVLQTLRGYAAGAMQEYTSCRLLKNIKAVTSLNATAFFEVL
jgi:hypothetical protein